MAKIPTRYKTCLGPRGEWDYHLQVRDDNECNSLCGEPGLWIEERKNPWGAKLNNVIPYSYCKTCEGIATRKIK